MNVSPWPILAHLAGWALVIVLIIVMAVIVWASIASLIKTIRDHRKPHTKIFSGHRNE